MVYHLGTQVVDGSPGFTYLNGFIQTAFSYINQFSSGGINVSDQKGFWTVAVISIYINLPIKSLICYESLSHY